MIPAMVSRLVASLLVLTACAVMFADSAWGVDIIDRGAFNYTDPYTDPTIGVSEQPQRDLNTGFEDTLKSDDGKLFDASGPAPESEREEQERHLKDLDWCYWWATSSLAEQPTREPTIDAALEIRLRQCASKYSIVTGWAGKAITILDNIHLLEALGEPEAEAQKKVLNNEVSIELTESQWKEWFQADAAAVPAPETLTVTVPQSGP